MRWDIYPADLRDRIELGRRVEESGCHSFRGRVIAADYGISASMVSRIKTQSRWTNGSR